MTTMIEARGVGKVYERDESAVGLHDLSLEVSAGQVLALLGPNGAGKTTMVRGLATLLRFDRGEARVAGFDVATQSQQVRERIALVGQGVAVDEQLTALQNLVLFGRLRGLDRARARRRAVGLVADFGLGGDENRPVSGFSGGMRRRLDVAASIIVRPDVLFVDEPTTGLDPAARRDLWQALSDLVAAGTAILLTTQYLEEADALADHIVLLAHGRAVAEGTADDLKARLGRSVLEFTFETPDEAATAQEVLAAIDPRVETGKGSRLTMQASGRDSLMTSIQALAGRGISPTEAALRKPSLDEAFLHLTADLGLQRRDEVEEVRQ